ncbi:MAG: AMP-binding protein, partial [Proteobacteria bacterium]|nr:AMP-binding protein [Pseudomonadota bacterium]
QVREAQQFEQLREQLRYAKANIPAYADLLYTVDPEEVKDRSLLARLPVTRKSEMGEAQAKAPPLGGYTDLKGRRLPRVFASPGAIFEPQADSENFWRLARALHAAGCREGDLVYNTFSYHFTPAGFMLESGAHALGCTVFPAGVGQTELQVQAMAHLRPHFYVGTPSFLKILLDKAKEMKADVSSLKLGLVSGEALPGPLRAELSDSGVDVLQGYATADVGLIGYESQSREGLLLDEEILLEIVRPGTGDPVDPGEVGEVLVTPLKPGYPLIRFATGDLSAAMEGISPCGRTSPRIKGWMGRADQTTKVRGMFVHPSQVAAVVARHDEIRRVRLEISRVENTDVMKMLCEVTAASGLGDDFTRAVAESIREVCKLRGEVELVETGQLPNDGKVIDDQRPIE